MSVVVEPTVHIISEEVFETDFKDKVGSLMFPDEYWSCKSYVDKPLLKKKLKLNGKIKDVLVKTGYNSNARINKLVKYKTELRVPEGTEDAKYYPCSNGWYSGFPIGDVWIVSDTLPNDFFEDLFGWKNGEPLICYNYK